MNLTGREKATIFLSILGADTAARILRYLPDELADLIASGISHLPSPSPDALDEVMEELHSYLALPGESFSAPRLEESPRQPAPARKNYSFLSYERPQLVAFLLAQQTDDKKQEILQSLTRDKELIESLLADLKPNSLSAGIAEDLKTYFGAKLP